MRHGGVHPLPPKLHVGRAVEDRSRPVRRIGLPLRCEAGVELAGDARLAPPRRGFDRHPQGRVGGADLIERRHEPVDDRAAPRADELGLDPRITHRHPHPGVVWDQSSGRGIRVAGSRSPTVPLEGLEPPTLSLGRSCSSIELQRPAHRFYRASAARISALSALCQSRSVHIGWCGAALEHSTTPHTPCASAVRTPCSASARPISPSSKSPWSGV